MHDRQSRQDKQDKNKTILPILHILPRSGSCFSLQFIWHAIALACPALLLAFVEEPECSHGVVFETDANTQRIRAPDKAVINCKKFNVGKDETVHFVQPSPKAKALCRVTGKEASTIEGTLKADGRLFLVNPQSIYFRETAKVDVHSLVASTLNIKDEDFIKGNDKFYLESDAKDSAIVIKGQINAKQDAVFMAPQIMNRTVAKDEIVKAEMGKVAFLGGELITLNFEGDKLISFAIDKPLQKGFIQQAGKVTGQEVLVKLRVANEMIRSVINVDGLEPATQMQFENGKIYLVAGSSITAPKIEVEGPLVETAGDFAKVSKLKINAEKELQVLGGTVKPAPNSEALLRASQGVMTIDGPFKYEKGGLKDSPKVTFSGKIIDQNAPVHCRGALTYSGATLLSGNIDAPQSNITFKGPVVIDGNKVEIKSGSSFGDIKFHSTLDADHPSCNLTIFNGKGAGRVIFEKVIGSTAPFSELSIETGKLAFHDIGSKGRPGAEKLSIKASNIEFFGTVAHAKEQNWDAVNFHLHQETTFITRERPLLFSDTTHLVLNPQTNVVFETHGGDFKLPNLSGDDHQSVTINTGHRESKIGELNGNLGPLHVQSRTIHIIGKIDVASIFMEAQKEICYGDIDGKVFQYELFSAGEVTLNAKNGNVGTEEFPMLVKSKGKLYLGAKSYAYGDGYCDHGFPYVYKKNPPPRIVYQGIETRYVFNEEIFREEEILLSLTPHLAHLIPRGFVDATHFTFRRAPIYFTHKDAKIGDSTDLETSELAQVEE